MKKKLEIELSNLMESFEKIRKEMAKRGITKEIEILLFGDSTGETLKEQVQKITSLY